MEHIESAYRDGVAEAESDIVAEQPKLRYGARGAWGEDLARTLRARFGVELVVAPSLREGVCLLAGLGGPPLPRMTP